MMDNCGGWTRHTEWRSRADGGGREGGWTALYIAARGTPTRQVGGPGRKETAAKRLPTLARGGTKQVERPGTAGCVSGQPSWGKSRAACRVRPPGRLRATEVESGGQDSMFLDGKEIGRSGSEGRSSQACDKSGFRIAIIAGPAGASRADGWTRRCHRPGRQRERGGRASEVTLAGREIHEIHRVVEQMKSSDGDLETCCLAPRHLASRESLETTSNSVSSLSRARRATDDWPPPGRWTLLACCRVLLAMDKDPMQARTTAAALGDRRAWRRQRGAWHRRLRHGRASLPSHQPGSGTMPSHRAHWPAAVRVGGGCCEIEALSTRRCDDSAASVGDDPILSGGVMPCWEDSSFVPTAGREKRTAACDGIGSVRCSDPSGLGFLGGRNCHLPER